MRLQTPVKLSSKNPDDMYPHDLQLYQNVPFGEVTLDELEEICETRLKGQFKLHTLLFFIYLFTLLYHVLI